MIITMSDIKKLERDNLELKIDNLRLESMNHDLSVKLDIALKTIELLRNHIDKKDSVAHSEEADNWDERYSFE